MFFKNRNGTSNDLLLANMAKNTMLSIEALLEIHSGDTVNKSSHTINLNSKCEMSPAILTPHSLKSVLASRKMTALKSLITVCSICRREGATNMCSSIVACPNMDDGCLNMVEKCYLTCDQDVCTTMTRTLRNSESKSGRIGTGFRLAFRGAIELIVENRDVAEYAREE